MSIIEKLTEGIISRNVQKEGQAVLDKWEKTGLLEGIQADHGRGTMALLLENQAKELLREASTMQAGDVEGFAAVAFPIVRRVFGNLIANDLVSVQPMSLPSGLIFFLDFTYGSQSRLDQFVKNKSIYGGGVVGAQLTGGVDLSSISGSESGFYNLNNGYASTTGSVNATLYSIASGCFGGVGLVGETYPNQTNGLASGFSINGTAKMQYWSGSTQASFDRLCGYDPDFISGTTQVAVFLLATASNTLKVNNSVFNRDDLIQINANAASGQTVRRLTNYSGSDTFWAPKDSTIAPAGSTAYARGDGNMYVIVASDTVNAVTLSTAFGATAARQGPTDGSNRDIKFSIQDSFGAADTLGAVQGQLDWALEKNPSISEIDIKVNSVSITANTKKLKARWTPELQQDINAYHNLDAEVELTSILSETIALEIDQEILEDLVVGASGGTYYWSRKPGKFVQRDNGNSTVESANLYPDFTGTVSEWYETLLETVNDVSANIHRKTLRGGANFLVCGPEVSNILEFTAGFRADTTADETKGTAGAMKVGQISKKWDVYVDSYFPRNVILVGRKGNSFLESGYVYAPYVPLQVTPTIFGPDDFVPRKGVMTRYGKKMLRPDMYGLVIVEDLLG